MSVLKLSVVHFLESLDIWPVSSAVEHRSAKIGHVKPVQPRIFFLEWKESSFKRHFENLLQFHWGYFLRILYTSFEHSHTWVLPLSLNTWLNFIELSDHQCVQFLTFSLAEYFGEFHEAKKARWDLFFSTVLWDWCSTIFRQQSISIKKQIIWPYKRSDRQIHAGTKLTRSTN